MVETPQCLKGRSNKKQGNNELPGYYNQGA